jgi:hypothetical protein
MSSSTRNLLIDFLSDLEQTAILWQIAPVRAVVIDTDGTV